MTNMITTGAKTIDSRDLAVMVGMTHGNLLKMIKGTKHISGSDHYVGIIPSILQMSLGYEMNFQNYVQAFLMKLRMQKAKLVLHVDHLSTLKYFKSFVRK